MEIEYKSELMTPTIELMKCIKSFSETKRNKKIGTIDYLIKDENSKRLIHRD